MSQLEFCIPPNSTRPIPPFPAAKPNVSNATHQNQSNSGAAALKWRGHAGHRSQSRHHRQSLAASALNDDARQRPRRRAAGACGAGFAHARPSPGDRVLHHASRSDRAQAHLRRRSRTPPRRARWRQTHAGPASGNRHAGAPKLERGPPARLYLPKPSHDARQAARAPTHSIQRNPKLGACGSASRRRATKPPCPRAGRHASARSGVQRPLCRRHNARHLHTVTSHPRRCAWRSASKLCAASLPIPRLTRGVWRACCRVSAGDFPAPLSVMPSPSGAPTRAMRVIRA